MRKIAFLSFTFFFLLTACEKKYIYPDDNYLGKLKDYESYYYETNIPYEPFYYAPPSDSLLTLLRERYKLEKIAGSGDELSRIINLMNWVSSFTIYKGGESVDVPRNAVDLIPMARNKGVKMNCRLIATILNDVYLSMGFKARFVSCMPASISGTDYHVVNIVYAESLGKWIYMDASFNAWFKDMHNQPLGISEIRINLLNERPIYVHKSVNMNGAKVKEADYINYMTRHMVRFYSPAHSEPNYDSKPGVKTYYHLHPAGFFPNLGTEITPHVQRIYMSNPDIFWAAPVYIEE